MDDIFKNLGNRQTLSQKIERTIENAIREKKLLIGSKLPTEHEMCEAFGVSRTALREALRRLSARGLINIKKGSGMYVSQITIEDAINSLNLYYDLKFDNNLLSQIIEVRRLFEPEIARLAAKNRTEENIKELDKNLVDFKKCNHDNTQLEADLDNKFHLIIAKSSGNPIMQITMEPIYSLLPRMRNYIYGNIEGEKDNTLTLHKQIIEAIRSKNELEAYELMTTHLNRTQEIYDKYMKYF
ncbi:MAG TPA: GntR family transcriptional regulator [Marinilabiliales bacterium]|jgi:GntR family transcriptional repressor for pyruvate dehydrogenase complex|nr:FadR family transcriptional regulator [Salinivirgaceae bacterium]OFX40286.1 MAG: GntR family transcriptional regulator [Bacteroidetes bacterium GWA2_40_14]OFX57344.1 MAG: GntR family transcriptional regulator [Bacteroidetes bacterium GWC2_40_13]OFX76205.1 MAG: GntR family transcriptional regulator [Bacteroidetes bacterium GWD2_40_43]OFX95346.1 MAG: GntR family transcriptional regulator [Bacteroidetes bacterium GWE2_40_63]OFY19010.1 MAG: GntR family transcriptional regulator [Bacteroidetes b